MYSGSCDKSNHWEERYLNYLQRLFLVLFMKGVGNQVLILLCVLCCSSRQTHVKTRERPHNDQMTEAWIVEAVVCYDFLHNDLTKPVQVMGLSGSDVDPSFRGNTPLVEGLASLFIFYSYIAEAIKVLYNRSRVSCILQKFEEGVNSKLYPPLPSLETVNLKLLKNEHEQKIIKKYIAGFLPMLDKFVPTRIAKICAELWRFLLFLSQDYSHYYSQTRTLCVSLYLNYV